MTTYAYPNLRPTNVEWSLRNFTAVHQSPFNGVISTQDRDGEHWSVRMMYDGIEGDRRAELLAFLYKLNGAQHRFTVQDFGYSRRGLVGGTPLVNGAAQTGKNLVIDGASFNITNWLREGDQISIGNNLHSVDADVDTDGAGNATIIVSPRIFVAPANNAAVEITTPIHKFVLLNKTVAAPTSSPARSAIVVEGLSAA